MNKAKERKQINKTTKEIEVEWTKSVKLRAYICVDSNIPMSANINKTVKTENKKAMLKSEG